MKLRHSFALWAGLAISAVVGVSPCSAGKIVRVGATVSSSGHNCLVRIEGEIVAGDAARLIAAFDGIKDDRNLCLDSPGGSFEEAIVIAGYMLENGVGTFVEAGAQCLSACSLVFMAGCYWFENTTIVSRKLHALGRLSFHAPYIPEAGGESNSALINKAYQAGVVAVGKLLQIIQTKSNSADKELVFPQALLAPMLMKGPSESYDIDTVRKVVEANIELVGYRDPGRITKKMVCTACGAVNPYFPFVDTCGDGGLYSEKRVDGKLELQAGIAGIEEGAGLLCKLTKWNDGAWALSLTYTGGGAATTRMTFGTWFFYPPEALIRTLADREILPAKRGFSKP
jgi:hypothetical protein